MLFSTFSKNETHFQQSEQHRNLSQGGITTMDIFLEILSKLIKTVKKVRTRPCSPRINLKWKWHWTVLRTDTVDANKYFADVLYTVNKYYHVRTNTPKSSRLPAGIALRLTLEGPSASIDAIEVFDQCHSPSLRWKILKKNMTFPPLAQATRNYR